jgi:phospholipase C
MAQSERQFTNVLDTFEHVVVLMLENRSFDNLLGYLYPSGQKFEGVDGMDLSNPIPPEWRFGAVTKVPVTRITDINFATFCPPYPDPGEDYPHVNTQLFNTPGSRPYNQWPYNLPSPVPIPKMEGFVTDYIQNFKNEFPSGYHPPLEQFYNIYKYVMQSYDPANLSVLSGLAREFAVFDHWFCSVPSETICNRNFWHAGTSWGHVINPGPADDPDDEDNRLNTYFWLWDTDGDTLFSRMSPGIGWKIYSDNRIPLSKTESLSLPVTPLLHLFNFLPMLDHPDAFKTLEDFKNHCANGNLPAYSFIEPNFFNPHNDMHPSTPTELIDGGPQKISPVLLGEALVCEVYNAIFTSPLSRYWDNTLLIITFDEHGGCYDHVIPPGYYGENKIDPVEIATPPDLSFLHKGDGFDFKRLGLRVPMIMVSPYIKKNTIINKPMSHTSFLRTMREKWGLSLFSAREDASPCFNVPGLLWPTLQRKDRSEMPVFAAPLIPPDDTDYSKAFMSAMGKVIMFLLVDLWCEAFPGDCPTTEIKTNADAAAFVHNAVLKLRQVGAVEGQTNERHGMLFFQAIARELKKKQWRRR